MDNRVQAFQHEERIGMLPDVAADGNASASRFDGLLDHSQKADFIASGSTEDDNGDEAGFDDFAEGGGITRPSGFYDISSKFGSSADGESNVLRRVVLRLTETERQRLNDDRVTGGVAPAEQRCVFAEHLGLVRVLWVEHAHHRMRPDGIRLRSPVGHVGPVVGMPCDCRFINIRTQANGFAR